MSDLFLNQRPIVEQISDDVRIPNRFESLLAQFGQGVRPLVSPIDDDLRAYNRLRDRARIQGGGLLCFLLGPSGIGKTTSAYSAAVNLPDTFAPMVSVPPDIDFREAAAWTAVNTPMPSGAKATIVLFDGREASDDEVGVGQFLAALNQFLRRRSDVIFCWPTTDPSWHRTLRETAMRIGGANFCPPESDYPVKGPSKREWGGILERMLLQFQKTYDDVGMAGDVVAGFAAQSSTIGDFLTKASIAVADRVSARQVTGRLPTLLFVITSSGDVTGEANRIRRAGKQILAPEPLLAHSPRSEAGKWWTERNKHPNTHLGYVISLFNATLITMSASAVVHACVLHGAADLKKAAFDKKAQPNSGSALQAVKASEFYKFLSGASVSEFTTGQRGRANPNTLAAYAAIQAMSAKRHKAINQAICALTRSYATGMRCEADSAFEIAQGIDLFTDTIVEVGERSFHTEFHHLSESQCRAARMSSYIMGKLRGYAIHHQLIPR